MLKLPRILISLHLVLLLATSNHASAEDWPQWLGNDRRPVWRETGVIDSLDKRPPLRWKTTIGSGYSGPAVAKGRVFLMDRQTEADLKSGEEIPGQRPINNDNFVRRRLPGNERVLCLNEADGKVIWTHQYDCPYTTVATYAIGPRCTPTVDENRVYTLGAEGDLHCLSADTGKVIWKRDFKDDYSFKVPFWGAAAHPLIDGPRLICIVGGPHATVVAFDKMTGKELWRALRAPEPGYCPPVITTFGKESHLVVWHSEAVCGLNPRTGEVYWQVPMRPTFAMSIGAPQFDGRSMFLMSFARKSALVKIADDNRSGEIEWLGNARRGIGGVLNTAIIRDGHIYAAGANGRYICAELKTGKRKWSSFEMNPRKRPAVWGNVFTVQHGDRYFHLNDVGDLILAAMNPDGFKELGRTHLIDPTHHVGGRTLVWSHPAFANRCIYLRNDKEIRCYSLAK